MKPAALVRLLVPLSLVPAASARGDEVAPEVRARIAERAQALLEGEHARGGFAGGSVALVLPDGSEVSCAVGMADAEEERAMQPTDRMLAGSIGKTFVSATALQAAAAGELELDATAASLLGEPDWLARLPNGEAVTLRQLLRHQSGFPRYVMREDFWDAMREDPARVWEPVELLAYVFDDPPLFAPGEGWAYSDTNYILLGLVLEAELELEIEEQIRARFLEPLELDATTPSDRRALEGLTQGYSGMLKRLGFPERALEDGAMVLNPQFEWCGGGYVSTPRDLAQWARALFGREAADGGVLDAGMRAEMLESEPAPMLGPGARYGLGAIVRETRAGLLVGHDGVFPGYTSTMGAFLEHDLAAAFQVNRDGPDATARPMHLLLVDLALAAREELAR